MSELKPTTSEETVLSARGYKLHKFIGEGTYAKVYLSEFSPKDDSHKTLLACKIIETAKAPREYTVKFLPREIDVLVRLNHPNLIHVHSIFQRKTKFYIFMRFSENGDLLGYVLKNGCVSENQSRVWFRQLALGIQYLHELHIAHRDIKCENVLLTANFNVKLSDFGFSRRCVDETNATIISETYCGSMSYAAPEIISVKPYLPKPTDLWSLGVVLFVMLNKAMPFDDTQMRKLYEQQMGKKYRFRTRVSSIVSLECKSIVNHLLEPDPGLRHSAHQVLSSAWIAMDSRLATLNAVEGQALERAREDDRRNSTSQPHPKQGDILDVGIRRGLSDLSVRINISEVHRMYQILEVEDNIKFMTIIEGTIKDNALNESVETSQEGGLNIYEDVKTGTVEKIDQNQVLIKTETRTRYVNIDGTDRERENKE